MQLFKKKAFPYSYAWTVIPNDSTEFSSSTLIITLSADGAETESVLTNSSALFVCVTQHQPDICRQHASYVSSLPQCSPNNTRPQPVQQS